MADGRVLLAAMDVAGKGMDAALIASGLHTTVHLCAALGLGLTEMVTTLNRYLIKTWDTVTSVTVAASILDPRTGVIESLNCSHPNPVIVGADGRVRELAAFETIPLGLIDFAIETRRDRLHPGELLAYYSDGLSELFDEADAMLGPDGVNRYLSEIRGPRERVRAPALVDRLHRRLAGYRGAADPSDDVSFILALVGG
jgi:sigma-B regulation protein RsbU (phosphoserine phosphatase)